MTSSTAPIVRGVAAFFAAIALALIAPALAAAAAAPDPFERGPYTPAQLDPIVLGTVNLQEPSGTGGAVSGSSAAVTVQVRGSAHYARNRSSKAPLIIFVHGNHSQCDFGSSPNCTLFKRNDQGYAYMAENLATWGYNVISLDQDQMMAFQDGTARGMHNRRTLIAALLDGLFEANQKAIPTGPNSTVGSTFVGKIDFDRIGMMGHSRGGDVVTSYLDYNRTRPAPGRRYNIRGVIALAPTDFERRAPYGSPFLTIQPTCDGDVTSQHGSRMFERGQVVMPGDPFPKIQHWVHGANHNWFNTVWRSDSEDAATGSDSACTTPSTIPNIAANPTLGTPIWRDQDPNVAPDTTTIRLSGNAYLGAYAPQFRASGDPERMGDQQRIGLATMNTFLRRYVGGEAGFEPYMTGELGEDGGPAFARNACPTSAVGTRIACKPRVKINYYAGAQERKDVIGPEPDTPLTKSALGTSITASGFANPFLETGGVQPTPPATSSGLDWCNPETPHYTASALGLGTQLLNPKACPLPGTGQLGFSAGTPVNRSYGLQYAVAWDNPVGATGEPAKLATRIPAADGDVSGFKALTMAAAVNYWDARNPDRGERGLWDPEATTQDFTIALTDSAGREGTVSAADPRFGTSLQQTISSTAGRVHVMLDGLRVPLADFAAQGVDLTKVRRLELRFGEAGKPQTGSIQLADVGFQEPASGGRVLAERPGASGPAGGDTVGPNPMTFIADTPRIAETKDNPEPIGIDGAVGIATAKAAGCVDTTAPTTTFTARLRGGSVVLRGKAADAGCASLASVQVGVYRLAKGGKRAQAVLANGKLGPVRPLSTRGTLVAKGTSAWSLTVGKKLPKGTYKVAVRVLDSAGNATTTKLRTIRVR